MPKIDEAVGNNKDPGDNRRGRKQISEDKMPNADDIFDNTNEHESDHRTKRSDDPDDGSGDGGEDYSESDYSNDGDEYNYDEYYEDSEYCEYFLLFTPLS